MNERVKLLIYIFHKTLFSPFYKRCTIFSIARHNRVQWLFRKLWIICATSHHSIQLRFGALSSTDFSGPHQWYPCINPCMKHSIKSKSVQCNNSKKLRIYCHWGCCCCCTWSATCVLRKSNLMMMMSFIHLFFSFFFLGKTQRKRTQRLSLGSNCGVLVAVAAC